ncbi:tubby like protein 8 isoform X2 [Carex rostrata]
MTVELPTQSPRFSIFQILKPFLPQLKLFLPSNNKTEPSCTTLKFLSFSFLLTRNPPLMSDLKRVPLLPLNTNIPKCLDPGTNAKPETDSAEKENPVPKPAPGSGSLKGRKPQPYSPKNPLNKGPLKSSSLQMCMKLNEADPGLKLSDRVPHSSDIWEFSDSESAPASSWSTLPNRALLSRPLPLDVGRCTCIIAKETVEGERGISVYSLYTNEGQGRQDRKLAIARHRRRRGRSEFIVAQNPKGIFVTSDEGFLGTISANLVGSKYKIFNQGKRLDTSKTENKKLLGVVMFVPTITTFTGRFRSIRALIPRQLQSTQLKSTSTNHIQHVNGLTKDWDMKKRTADQLVSRVPFYNSVTKRYELDYRERSGRTGQRVQTSVKNFQMTMEEKSKQTILQLGRIGKSKYIMDFRYPLTGYQAFCICLAAIDSKLCCTL